MSEAIACGGAGRRPVKVIAVTGGKGGVGAATDIVRSMKTAMWLGGVA